MKTSRRKKTFVEAIEKGIAQFEAQYGCRPSVLVLRSEDAQSLFRATAGGPSRIDELAVLLSALAAVPLLGNKDGSMCMSVPVARVSN